MKVNSFGEDILEALFPNYCFLCGLRSRRSLPLCHGCQRDMPANNYCCRRCAIPLPPGIATNGNAQCGDCLSQSPPFDRVIAPWLYSEQLALLIHRWKYQGERRLTPLLGALWLQGADSPPPVDLLVPVPLHWSRLWRRGYNQSELLARQLHADSPAIGRSHVERRLAKRVRPTPAQAGMTAAQRTGNLRGAFTSNKPCDNLRVAIIDDVLTTGATAAALASTLRAAGASYIEVWCLARTPAPAP